MLTDGNHLKSKVDFILDEIFNTMTSMMLHMREIIYVIYNRLPTDMLCMPAEGWPRLFEYWLRVELGPASTKNWTI
ncbi:hypothetical protein DPMN_026529 [Dreissena polymorpha]|uniref:Uncharacterized protein n=1 Tax=Dreissena polymorpha TaxID=45954 RepID=A0A9D4LTL3_DREPO|nr:hypothetical protein DPMN_026529 [Dreissena polymorpha]